jgi:hypothetical protein
MAVGSPEVLSLDHRVGDPERIADAAVCEVRLHAALGIAKRFLRREHVQVHTFDPDQEKRPRQHIGDRLRYLVVLPVVGTVPVHPECGRRLRKLQQLGPVGLPHPAPVVARVEQPVLRLAGMRRGADQRHVDHVEQPRVRTVLVLALVLGDFLAGPRAHGPDPRAGAGRRHLAPGHAASRVLLRVGQAKDALDDHLRSPPLVGEQTALIWRARP